MPDNILRRVWTGAKRPVPPLNLMCEAEFLRACELVVASGGKLPGLSNSASSSPQTSIPHASVWKDANPQNGYLGAMDVQRVLKRSQLSDNILRRVWKAAKNPVPPLDKMNEAEFLRACQLVEEAGGTVLMGGGSSAGEPTPSISDAPAVPARSVAATDSSHLQHEYHSVWLLGEPTVRLLVCSYTPGLVILSFL